ncbi:hypothetical protein HDV00_009583 [Rhizophlyctis rosea]|nr:hypothetical protein HDV00_009583 [Rhizophlyctis rosea]
MNNGRGKDLRLRIEHAQILPHGPDGWFPNQKLTRAEALKGFTLSAAWAAFQENELGSITAGKKADFVMFDRDFMDESREAREILDAKVVATVVGGKVMFGNLSG